MSEFNKKILKIVGFIALIILALYVVIFIMLGGIGQITGDMVSNESGTETMSIFQAGVPSAKGVPTSSGEIAMDSAMPARDMSANTVTSAVDKKVIKTGDLNLKVEKAETAAEAIVNIAKVNKGEVASSNFYESTRGVKSGYITIRVPYNNFDKAFNEIKKVATLVTSESSNVQDITEQYIDLEARLKNTKAEEASFVALLSRSGKIEEILAVTKEVARVRGQIEQLEGQMRYLDSQTDMSTITVNLSEDVEIASVSKDWRPWQVVKLSVKRLMTSGQNFIDGLIAFLIIGLPMLLIYGLIIWLLYYVGKKIYCHYNR